jgi:hypothetical protein
MNRRVFLALTGGALGSRLGGQPACPDGDAWIPQGQLSDEAVPGPFSVCLKPPAIQIPPAREKVHEFKPAPTSVVPRRRWSTIEKNDPLWGDLKLAYQRLWNKKDPYRKNGLPYQMWWHNYYCGGSASIGDIHSNWFFLPWHRAFTYFHEQTLAELIHKPTFRLPAWDWEGDRFQIPPFYQELGTASFVMGNNPRCPQNPENYKIEKWMLQAWLWSNTFEDFCGFPDDRADGMANSGPHTIVHQNFVGGAMGPAPFAAGDPLFYSHHANVDRHWSGWMKQYPDLKPSANGDQWLNQPLYFYDQHDRLVSVQPHQLLDETKLGYCYEDSSPEDLSLNLLESGTLLDVWQNGLSLYQSLLSILGASLTGSTSLLAIAGILMSAIKDGSIADLWQKTVMSLPIQLRIEVPKDKLTAGKYMLVQLCRGKDACVIGGFGIFGDSHNHSASGYAKVAVAGSIDQRVLKLLITGQGPVTLRWGQAYAPGLRFEEPRQNTATAVSFSMLYPKTYSAAKSVLDSISSQFALPPA